MGGEIRDGLFALILVLRLHVLLLGSLADVSKQALRNLEAGAELLKRMVFLLQLLAVVVDVAEHCFIDEALRHELTVVFRVGHRVERNEIVGHDTSAAIYHAVLAQGVELQ